MRLSKLIDLLEESDNKEKKRELILYYTKKQIEQDRDRVRLRIDKLKKKGLLQGHVYKAVVNTFYNQKVFYNLGKDTWRYVWDTNIKRTFGGKII